MSTTITTSWKKIKEVYCGNTGYNDVYWRMYARITSQNSTNTTVAVEGRIYVSGSSGYFYTGATTTSGGVVGDYSAWGIDASGTYYTGETAIWVGSDTVATSTGSINAGVKFYSSPWGWTSTSLYISDTLIFSAVPTPDLTGIGVTPTTATIGWFVDDGEGSIDGTGYIYGGTTPSPTTQLFTTTLKNDVFVDTGLTQGVTYYYRGRIKDANDNWGEYTPDLRLTTTPLTNKIYGSANDLSNLVTDIYGSANSQANRVTRVYGSENGVAKLTYQGFGHLDYS